MNNILNFAVDKIELIDKINNSFFRKVKIKAFATGENAHTLPIDKDVLERGAKTIYNKPIIWKYNHFIDDAMGHEKDEVPCGFVPESDDNPIAFEEHNGKIYIVIYALIWTRYCGRLIKIFERDEMKKGVSIEIATIEENPVDSNKPKVKDFIIAGITLLGEYVNPACKGCEAELLEFSDDKKKYLISLNFAENYIEIDNSKDSSVDGEWSNPRRRLFDPISKASNKTELLKEAYLEGDFSSDDPEITKFKYPHHVIRDKKLVLHQRGVEAAFQRASQQGIVSGDVKSHLLRHYKELGLNTQNFSEFNMSAEEFNLYFSEDFFSAESVGESNMNKDEKLEGQGMTVEEEKMEKGTEELCDNIIQNEDAKPKVEDDDDENEPDDNDDNDSDDDENKNQEMSIEDAKTKMTEMAEQIKKLECDNAAYMSKIESMADYKDLKIYKEMAEAEKVKEAEMAEMEKVMSSIEERGINMSESDKSDLMSKIKDFDSVTSWANFAKAQVFDRVENIDGVTRIGLPYGNTSTKSGSIWDRI